MIYLYCAVHQTFHAPLRPEPEPVRMEWTGQLGFDTRGNCFPMLIKGKRGCPDRVIWVKREITGVTA